MATTAKKKLAKSKGPSEAASDFDVSGSEWTADHLKAFAIINVTDDALLDFLTEKEIHEKARLSGDASELLEASVGRDAEYSSKPHANLFQMAQEKNVQFGPFLAFIAVVSQAWKETKEIGGRTSPRIAAHQALPSYAEVVQKGPLVQFIGATPQKQTKPISPVAPEQTPRHVAARQEKAEIVNNTMAVLFLQAILESSRASMSPAGRTYLEWHFIPTRLHVASSKATCQCVNDGSLFRKHWQQKGNDREWITTDKLLYMSIEAKAKYGIWKGEQHEQTLEVKAQEASQMIGMICERIKASKGPLKTEYDRTTFLVACTATSIIFKFATFSEEYIRYYGLGKNPLVSSFTAAMEELNIQKTEPVPSLVIHETEQYSLRQGKEAIAAAEYSLAILEYLQKHGPLLEN